MSLRLINYPGGKNYRGRSGLPYRLYIIRQGRTLAMLREIPMNMRAKWFSIWVRCEWRLYTIQKEYPEIRGCKVEGYILSGLPCLIMYMYNLNWRPERPLEFLPVINPTCLLNFSIHLAIFESYIRTFFIAFSKGKWLNVWGWERRQGKAVLQTPIRHMRVTN